MVSAHYFYLSLYLLELLKLLEAIESFFSKHNFIIEILNLSVFLKYPTPVTKKLSLLSLFNLNSDFLYFSLFISLE
jgi:hypothetical protein